MNNALGLLLATSNGIYVSKDNGVSWFAWNEGLKSKFVIHLGAFDKYIWASCRGTGIYKRKNYELNFVNSQEVLGKNEKELIAYPNPSAGILNVEVPESGHLFVFDSFGRLNMKRIVAKGGVELNLTHFLDGTYNVVLKCEERIYSSWVVVSHD